MPTEPAHPTEETSQPTEKTSEKTLPPRLHVAYLDGLRALAALLVIFDHIALQTNFGGAEALHWVSRIAHFLATTDILQ
jgi:peptidoglycan/LPS O-acetylase OafA/YrhL